MLLPLLSLESSTYVEGVYRSVCRWERDGGGTLHHVEEDTKGQKHTNNNEKAEGSRLALSCCGSL